MLVTGASSGIGAATARAFAKSGYTVYATARHKEALQSLMEAGCHALALDVTDEASMQAAVREVEARTGCVDVLINNAGFGLNGPVEELSMDDIRRQFETNVFGLVRLSQLVLPSMRRKGRGRILNIGSVGGSFTTPGAGAYHASKYAVEAFNDALRFEAKPFGVEVVLIKPTGVKTPFFAKINQTLPQTGPDSAYALFKENYARVTERVAAGPGYGLVTAEKVARTVLLAAEAEHPRSRYVVGISGHVYLALRGLLSDRAWDKMMGKQFPMRPAKSAS